MIMITTMWRRLVLCYDVFDLVRRSEGESHSRYHQCTRRRQLGQNWFRSIYILWFFSSICVLAVECVWNIVMEQMWSVWYMPLWYNTFGSILNKPVIYEDSMMRITYRYVLDNTISIVIGHLYRNDEAFCLWYRIFNFWSLQLLYPMPSPYQYYIFTLKLTQPFREWSLIHSWLCYTAEP